MQSSLNFLQKLSLLLCFVVIFLDLQGLRSFGTTGLIVFGVWLIVTVIAFPKELRVFISSRRFVWLFVFLLFYFLSSIFVESLQTSVNRCVAFLRVFSPVIMYETLRDRSVKLKSILIIFTFAIFLVNIALSYTFLEVVGANNLRGVSEDYGSEFYVVNMVFNMCYAFAILIPGLIEILRKYRKKEHRKFFLSLLLVALSAILLVYLIRAQFMTAMVLSLVGALVAFFYKGPKSLVSVAVVLAIAAGAFVALYPKLSQNIDSSKYRDTLYRLDEIYATMTGRGHEASDMNSRQDLTSMSVETFFHNPLFGVNHKLTSSMHPNDAGIGNHAEWPDSLARYGLFAILLFMLLWDSLKRQRQFTGAYFPTFLFIALGFLNPMWYFPQMFVTFVLLPMIGDIAVKTKA